MRPLRLAYEGRSGSPERSVPAHPAFSGKDCECCGSTLEVCRQVQVLVKECIGRESSPGKFLYATSVRCSRAAAVVAPNAATRRANDSSSSLKLHSKSIGVES